ncbi:toxin VasX [Pseudomonas helleri]|uniref:toxin VasX n=1 Tax=Pseudomonas helleri TaxID=1608996 RepID=UPI0028EAC4AD|nr:toxin VasX [Pseudomonas helleri]
MNNPNHIDLSRSDAKSALGVCPLRKARVQLLPLRYGVVERLDPAAELAMPFPLASRPLGIRLLRDGWLYVIDNSSGYLHEYRVLNGDITQLLWQGAEINQDQRQGMDTQKALLFSRSTTLHIAYSEVQWTAYKCSKMIGSRDERDHFMQVVDLSKADCVKGGSHLLTDAQAKQWLAEVAEPSTSEVSIEGMHPAETQDYAWEDQPQFQKTHMAAVKRHMLAAYEHDHLYLVFNDTLGVMRDLAQEQDTVVGWIDEWVGKEKQELKYLVGSYIETLMVLNDQSAPSAGVSAKLFEKTTERQREAIYDYLNARNTLKGMPSSASPEKASYPGHGFDASNRLARQSMNDKKHAMHEALGEPLYDELKDDIEALQDHGDAALQGRGLGSRGIHDLVRHQEMTAYLEAERVHIKRWTARLDRITQDRTQLFATGNLHRSLWYFDPQREEQLQAALIAEHNCVRDLCRTDESLQAVGEYLHVHPYYILPAFGSRLDWTFINSKAGDVIKLLDDKRNAQENIATAQGRLVEVQKLLGRHWANSLALSPQAMVNSQLVQAAYSPAAALRTEQWLVKLQRSLNSPALKAHLNELNTYSNRAHRLAGLIALEHEGATLRVARAQDVQQFSTRIANLNVLLKNEDTYKHNASVSRRDSNRRMLSDEQRQIARYEAERFHQLHMNAKQERWELVKKIQSSLTVTASESAGFIGVKLKLDPQQQAYLNEEIDRLRSGIKGGYGEGRAGVTALKGGLLPLALMFWQVQTLGEAWFEWEKHFSADTLNVKNNIVFGGAIAGFVSSVLSVYQGVHITLVDKAFRSVQQSGGNRGGMLLAVKMGKLGLGLGGFISPLAFLGALGVSLSNLNKWLGAIRTGSAGEKAGALISLVGDTGNSGVAGKLMVNTFSELRVVLDATNKGPKVLGRAWALRGGRYLNYAAKITPWGLGFMVLSLGGEAIYNYNNLDEHQRWLMSCCWGNDDQGWDWPVHAQSLAEATLRPTINDLGITQHEGRLDKFRTLEFSFPGVSIKSLFEYPICFTAQLKRDNATAINDVGEIVLDKWRFIIGSPLTLQLDLPYDWCGTQSLMLMRISVQPELAVRPLKSEKLFLHYRIPLDVGRLNLPIKGVEGIDHIGSMDRYELKPEHFNE